MSVERFGLTIPPDQFVHPRQTYLLRLLESGDFPSGADVLIKEAIEEYQLAFDTRGNGVRSNSSVQTRMAVSLPGDGPNTLLADKEHALTVQFGDPVEAIVNPSRFTSLVVMVALRNMDQAKIYPDWLRYTPINNEGNSRPTNFLLKVTSELRGLNGQIEVSAFAGATIASRMTQEVSIL